MGLEGRIVTASSNREILFVLDSLVARNSYPKFIVHPFCQVFPPTPNGHRSSQLSLMESIPNKAPSYDEDMDSIAEWGAIERGKGWS